MPTPTVWHRSPPHYHCITSKMIYQENHCKIRCRPHIPAGNVLMLIPD